MVRVIFVLLILVLVAAVMWGTWLSPVAPAPAAAGALAANAAPVTVSATPTAEKVAAAAAAGPAPITAQPRPGPAVDGAAVPASVPSEDEAPASAPTLDVSLRGSLVWHESMDRDAFRVAVRRAGVESPAFLQPDGSFSVFRKKAGNVDVLVYLVRDPIPLHTFFDVQLPAVGVSMEPRLQGIDVRDPRRVALTLVSADGGVEWRPAIPGLHPRGGFGEAFLLIDLIAPSGDRRRLELMDPVVVPVRGAGYRAEISMLGYHSVRLENLYEDRDVVLEPVTHVEVAIDRRGLRSDQWLQPILRRVHSGQMPRVGLDLASDGIQTLSRQPNKSTFGVTTPGTYQIFWREETGEPLDPSSSAGEHPARRFRVEDMRRKYEFTIAVGAEDLERR
ncbi:MAG: hypothetical protein AAF628_28915 [Planctomycetota bacterium]